MPQESGEPGSVVGLLIFLDPLPQALLTQTLGIRIIRHRHHLRQARAPAGFASVDVAAFDRLAALRAGVGDGLWIGLLLVQSR